MNSSNSRRPSALMSPDVQHVPAMSEAETLVLLNGSLCHTDFKPEPPVVICQYGRVGGRDGGARLLAESGNATFVRVCTLEYGAPLNAPSITP